MSLYDKRGVSAQKTEVHAAVGKLNKDKYYKLRECGSSSIGRAIAFQAIGREFETHLPLH